ncbi:hypothetical protein G9A89_017045 [Geosiphon pyriformis]|nr:hypothetical protein G9A89_017045 [Geosiphon pyriformis]
MSGLDKSFLGTEALEVNSVIAEAVNSSTFVVLGGDFNENGSGKSATFRFCLGLGLSNSQRVEKTINFIFVSGNLSSAVTGYQVCSVAGFFNTDYNAVLVSISLGGLLDVWLNSLCKQTNKNHWKFKIKDTDGPKWTGFRDCLSTKLLVVAEKFFGAKTHGNVNVMWTILEQMVFHCSRNKYSSKFFGLELLVAKIVKKFGLGNLPGVDCLIRTWSTLNSIKACVFTNLVGLGKKSEVILGHLSLVYKKYRKSKMYESRLAEEAFIRLAVLKHMENFCFDKDSIIRSVLDRPFYKVVLNHLVIDDELILEPKKAVLLVVPDLWTCQYASLDYM